ncbi:MAG: proton-conducting membrane transporter [Blautia sp.]|nr:proton-conducting membrane transporter [Blautia sp.]
MNPQLILVPVFLPIAGGLFLLSRHEMEEKRRLIFLEIVACITTLFVWIILIGGRTPVMTLYRFVQGFSIDFQVDTPSMLFAGMVSLMWPLLLLYAFSYMKGEAYVNSFFSYYLMTYGITLGLAFSADILTMFVFYELLTLVTLPLVGHYRDHESMYAVRKYSAYLVFGASLALFSMILVTMSGNEGVFIYGGSLEPGYAEGLMRIAYLLGFFGFGIKAAIFPFHSWLPTASVAPTPVTALLHAVAVVNSGAFAVMRLTYYNVGPDLLYGSPEQSIAVFFSAFTLIYAAVLAVKERHFKRRLAYSTVSNLSYMLFGFSLMTPAGFVGGMGHLVFHGTIKIVLFMCAGAFMHCSGRKYVYEVNGVGKRMPVTFVMYTIACLGLIGLPMTCGFISKYQLIMAGIAMDTPLSYLGVGCLIFSAFLCAIYSLSVAVRAFFSQPEKDLYVDSDGTREADGWMLVPIIACTGAILILGMFPAPVVGLIRSACGL